MIAPRRPAPGFAVPDEPARFDPVLESQVTRAPRLAALLLAATPALAEPSVLTSPTGRVEVSFALAKDGSPTYSVSYGGKPVAADSRLGLTLRQTAPLAAGFRVLEVKRASRDETYALVAGGGAALHLRPAARSRGE